MSTSIWLSVLLAATPTDRSREAKALTLYKQGKLDRACSLFAAIAQERRDDGAAWSDLGLCELRRKHVEDGRRATLLALRHGNADVRKQAAYNWSRYLQAQPAPEQTCCEVQCEQAKPVPELGCSSQPWMCWQTQGNLGWGNGNWMQEVWLFIDTASSGPERGKAWLENTGGPYVDPKRPVPAGAVSIMHDSLSFFRPRETDPTCHCGEPDTDPCPDGGAFDGECPGPLAWRYGPPTGGSSKCDLLVVDPCGRRVFFRCRSFDDALLDKHVVSDTVVEFPIHSVESKAVFAVPRTIADDSQP